VEKWVSVYSMILEGVCSDAEGLREVNSPKVRRKSNQGYFITNSK
jgi:hypothetical protein